MAYEFGGGIAGKVLGRAAEPIVRSNLEKSVNQLKSQTEKLTARVPHKTAAKSAAKPAKRATTTRSAKR
jgi:hypothetical protein